MILISKYLYRGPEFVGLPGSNSSYLEPESHQSILTKSEKMNKLTKTAATTLPGSIRAGRQGQTTVPKTGETGKYKSQLS